jgi:hypothetical protein
MLFIPLFNAESSDTFIGKYRIVFKDVKDFTKLPVITEAKEYKILGKTVEITRTAFDLNNLRYYIYVEIKENPLPVLALVIAVLSVLGLSLTYMTFSKIEKIIDSPAIEILIIIIIVTIIYLLFKYIRFAKPRMSLK